jgi:hypothetical protein
MHRKRTCKNVSILRFKSLFVQGDTTKKQTNSDRQIEAVAIELPPLFSIPTVVAAFSNRRR